MRFIIFALLFCSFQCNAQLISGDVVKDGRKLKTPTDFSIASNKTGVIYFELSVDREGNVTSEKLLLDKTTVTSTPTRAKVKEYVSGLKFEPGTHYPHFHNVVIKITVTPLPPPVAPIKSI